MEDYELQEEEFWGKLAEEGMSRAQMLRRSAAAAAGLTILASPAVAAARSKVAPTPPALAALIARAKKEGHLNTIALPPDWSNYGEQFSTFQKKYGIKMTNASPEVSSGDEIQAIISLKGQSRAPDAVDVSPGFAIQGANQGLFAKYKVRGFATIPRA